MPASSTACAASTTCRPSLTQFSPRTVRVLVADLDRVRVLARDPGAALRGERRRVVRHRALVEHRQGDVEVVEPRVDQLERHHRHGERGGQLGPGGGLGAEAAGGQDPPVRPGEVALALVHGGRRDDLDAERAEQRPVRRCLVRADRLAEPRSRARGRRRRTRRSRRTPCPGGRPPARGRARGGRAPTYVARSRSHCSIARAVSTGRSGSIHGLIAYVTVKWSGRHITYSRCVAAVAATAIESRRGGRPAAGQHRSIASYAHDARSALDRTEMPICVVLSDRIVASSAAAAAIRCGGPRVRAHDRVRGRDRRRHRAGADGRRPRQLRHDRRRGEPFRAGGEAPGRPAPRRPA